MTSWLSGKAIKYGIAALVVIGMASYWFIGRAVWNANVSLPEEYKVLYIPTGSSYETVEKMLKDSSILDDIASFRRVAGIMKYNRDNVPPGKYRILSGMSNRELIKMLRSGDQAPQEVVLNNVRNLEEMAGKASRYFETDSLTFLRYLSDPEIFRPLGYTRENFISMFIPNTYHMFWTDKPEKFVKRMKKEFDKFWTEDKIARVKKNNLNLIDAYTVASIVEKESIYDPEKPTIAGVYINRLKTGEKLQADPTVVFAVGDFSIQRVLYSHLEKDSPYNTYKYAGLPPGPICMPSLSSLNAVINAENHNYMFFCAKPDNTGQHAFAVDYAGHQKNAEAFAQWLNKLNIK